MDKRRDQKIRKNVPITKNKDIQFSFEVADADDLEALEKAKTAERRQEKQ